MIRSEKDNPRQSRFGRKRGIPGILVVPLAMSLIGALAPLAMAAMESDDVGMYGSITVSRRAHTAATAMKKGDFGMAQGEYRTLIGLSPKTEDFYFGLYESSVRLNQWDQVALALEELFKLDPTYKEKLNLEYGICLYHQNRYDEAEPLLKKALASINEPSLVEDRLKTLMTKSIIKHEKVIGKVFEYKEPEKFVMPERNVVDPESVHAHRSKYGLTLENAFTQSESIVVAEYKNYESDGLISFFDPPRANFVRTDFLKGHVPLNRSIPIRFEFHEKIGEKKPDGWKFDKDKMPKPGSKWILFINSAVPIDGMIETYHGSYGRMEFNEDNYDKIMQIIEQHKGQTR